MNDRQARIDRLGYDYQAAEKTRVITCNLCASNEAILVSRSDRYGFAAYSWLCRACGLAYLSPRLTSEAYAAFYAQYYRPLVSAYHGRQINQDTIQAEQIVYAQYVWELLALHLQENAHYALLDVGGSTGVVARTIRALAGQKNVTIDITILDPAPLEVEVARKEGLETIAGFVEDFLPDDRRWDIVLLCQTVDHLLDVGGTLAKIHDLLDPDGYFFIDVVDWEFALRKHGRIEEAVKIDHPYMLTRAAMEFYLRSTGYTLAAQAVSPSKHLVGFLCRAAASQKPDPTTMKHHADYILHLVRRIQAVTP